jgi:DNA-binding NarL/FixJ family response regulator
MTTGANKSHGTPAGAAILIFSDICIYRESVQFALGSMDAIAQQLVAESLVAAQKILAYYDVLAIVVDMASVDAEDFLRSGLCRDRRTAALTLIDDPKLLLSCMAAGIYSFVSRSDSVDTLQKCVETLISGGDYYSPRIAPLLIECAQLQHQKMRMDSSIGLLTERQSEIMNLVEQGYSNKAIAQELSLELSTIKNHMQLIFRKLKVRNRGQAASAFRSSLRFATRHQFADAHSIATTIRDLAGR